MGSFFICPSDHAPDRIETLIRAHEDRGFRLCCRLCGGGMTAHVFDALTKPSVTSPAGEDAGGAARASTGAAVVGNLVYRGLADAPALDRYLDDRRQARRDPTRVIGHFATIEARPDALTAEADPMGIFHLFISPDRRFAASSFWAMLNLLPRCTADPDGVYEYAWNGTTFGAKTFVREIRKAGPRDRLICRDGRITTESDEPLELGETRLGLGTLDDYAHLHLDRLRAVFADLAALYGDRLRVSISGGFDSRLILALVLDQGIRPSLFTYGRKGRPETGLAVRIADGEGLDLDIIDKTTMTDPDPDRFRLWMARDAVAFDGWKNDGLFDNGADYLDRCERHHDGRVPLNGGLGEIYRNFFYLTDRRWRVMDIVDAFFSRFAPAAATATFDAERYRRGIGDVIADRLGVGDGPMDRARVEQIYPLLRGRDWTAREVNVNHRFGQMYFPFIYWQTIRGTCDIPIAYKTYGRLEGRMIALLSERLAGYPSNYGFDFASAPSWKYRVKHQASLRRPPGLRRLSYRIKWRHPVALPAFLDAQCLGRCMDISYPCMSPYFHMDRLYDPDARNRVATMEYLFQTFGVQSAA